LSVLSQTVKETRVTLGGGCAEMAMSNKVDEAARTVKGKKALAVEAFSRALRQVSPPSSVVRVFQNSDDQIPTILADNGGYDSSDLVTKLRAAHYEGQTDAGLGKLMHTSHTTANR